MKFILLLILIPLHLFSACIPPKEFIKYPDKFNNIGMYQRVHPSGRYILHSSIYFDHSEINDSVLSLYRLVVNPASVYIFDLKTLNDKQEATPIKTPLANEAYPVMTDWSLISSPVKNEGMKYYSFKDILSANSFSRPDFIIKNHNEVYQSVGELEDKNGEKIIRVTLFSDSRTADYRIKMKDGNAKSYEEIKNGSLCSNITQMDEHSQFKKNLEHKKMNTLDEIDRNESFQFSDNITDNNSASISQNIKKHLARLHQRRSDLSSIIGRNPFSSPVLSVDGRELATLRYKETGGGLTGFERTLHIYKINDDFSCELVDSLDFLTSKVQFSHPIKGKKGKVSFISPQSVQSGVVGQAIIIYDRDSKELKPLTKFGEYSKLGYPGFTLDGRIIFPACKADSNNSVCGSVIIDPNQIDNSNAGIIENPPSCLNEQGQLETHQHDSSASKPTSRDAFP